MARAISRQQLTPADEVRDLLTACDKRAVNIRYAGADQALELLQWLDRIHTLLPTLAASGIDLGPEQVQWRTVQGSVRRHESEIRRELQSLGGIANVRPTDPLPSPDQWWWWLDVSHRSRLLRRLAITVAGLVAIFLIALSARWVINRFFPVDPAVQQAVRLQTTAERAITSGDLQTAIISLEQAAQLRPEDVDPRLWLRVLYDITGETAAMADTDSWLRQHLSESDLASSLAMIYLQMDQLETALSLAESAISLDPDSPQSHLAAGSAQEELGNLDQALIHFARASELAEASDQVTLQALARIRMANVIQQQALPLSSPTAQP